MRKLAGIGAGLAGLLLASAASPATAGLITLDPDDFADGTVLNNVVPGLTVSAVDGGGGAIGNVTALTSPFGASTGTKVFETQFSIGPGEWGDGFWDYMLIDVTGLLGVASVSLDFVATDAVDANPILAAYNAAGIRIAESTAPGNFGTGQVVPLTVAASGISFVAALGDPGTIARTTLANLNAATEGGRDSWGLDNLRVQVPEPSTLTLFGVVLAALGFMTRRRRKTA